MIESVSRRAFGSSSGTYHVRDTELARERKLNIFYVTVFFLDDTQHSFQIEKKAKGSVLLEQVFQHIELVEKDYFGLQYTENGSIPSATNTDVTRWLDSTKSVKKQSSTTPQFWLAVRFYPPEPSRLAEEYTRYLLCLQLRKLLMDGRMTAPKNTALLLASFTVQAELGDYSTTEHPTDYLTELCLIPKQTAEDERRIKELHKLHKGQTPADAEANFLEHAKRLECYGVECHAAKDYNGKDIQIGVTSIGIVVFQNNIRINTFSWGKIVKISFKRKQFFIQLKREPSETYDTVVGFNMSTSRAAKTLWRSGVDRHSFFRLRAPKRNALWGTLFHRNTLTRTEAQVLQNCRGRSGNTSFIRRSISLNRSDKSVSRGVNLARTAKVTHQEDVTPKLAWGHDTQHSDDGGFLERALRVPLSYVDESETDEELQLQTQPTSNGGNNINNNINSISHNVNMQSEEENNDDIVTVRLKPGSDGRFGFNVRGGSGAPVLVSRVGRHTGSSTPPALQEGDQVISINGLDVEPMSHDDVVQLIRNTKGTLTLVLKPNAIYNSLDSPPVEPAVYYVPLAPVPSVTSVMSVTPAVTSVTAHTSMLLLSDCLSRSNTQYNTVPMVKDLDITVARLPSNVNKNRYKDIAPYDKNRVILKNGPSGDYINASYINMEIPNSDIVLSYIATQGPLPSTVGDFWQMVWESESHLIVMLTVLTERGRSKCHQYWPNVGQSTRPTDKLTVTATSELNLGDYIKRELTVKECEGAVRAVSHLQYVTWPDHGVPALSSPFIAFTRTCHTLRNHHSAIPLPALSLSNSTETSLNPPMIVHCSAGVGRSGALILAETALTLLNRELPVYPLDLLDCMREQRLMCIQTEAQYKFVCESILTAYTQGLIKKDEPEKD